MDDVYSITFLVSILFLLWSFYFFRRNIRWKSIPFLDVDKLIVGPVKTVGRPKVDTPLISYLKEIPCIYYRYTIEEHWEKKETYTDWEGKTRETTSSGWEVIAQGGEFFPEFCLENNGECVKIKARKAHFIPVVYSYTCFDFQSCYYEKAPFFSVRHSTGERRFTEEVIPIDQTLFVMGKASFDFEKREFFIEKGKGFKYLIISAFPEKNLTASSNLFGFILFSLGILSILSPAVLEKNLNLLLYLENILDLAFWGIILWTLFGYNLFVEIKERIEQVRSNIDVVVKERNNLIKALADTVRSYSEYEEEIQRILAKAREGEALLKAISERYPKIKAHKPYQKLEEEIRKKENTLRSLRENYNNIVAYYNAQIKAFHNFLIRKMAKLQPFEFLEES